VLRDISLEFPPPGRLIRAQGGNGGGKSTLLPLAAAVLLLAPAWAAAVRPAARAAGDRTARVAD
jgi:ABC-type Mn2+/Zn2+ transport system ATPase subunit